MDIRLPLVATIVGRSRNTLMRWETRELFVPRRNSHGHRIYSAEDVATLRHLAETLRPGRPRKARPVSEPAKDAMSADFADPGN
ncbi:MAG: MerR family transcriptional regulator [Gammaproteobacteria bacterium]